MADSATVRVEGLDEFRRDLGRVSPQLRKTLQQAHKLISTRVVEKARPAVAGLSSPGGARGARGITPRATQKDARIAFSQARARKPLLANILGANTHPVFGRYRSVSTFDRRIWQPHLGAKWQPTELYGIGPILEKAVDDWGADEYLDAFIDAARVAFPGAR